MHYIYILHTSLNQTLILNINDLPGVVSDGNKTVLYNVIHCVHDKECFQQDLNKINEWCENNKMRINASKCKVMRITCTRMSMTSQLLLLCIVVL